jgi:sensor histidine kinase YesM
MNFGRRILKQFKTIFLETLIFFNATKGATNDMESLRCDRQVEKLYDCFLSATKNVRPVNTYVRRKTIHCLLIYETVLLYLGKGFMSIQEFIFSNKRSDRIKQHLLFWGTWYPYITLTHAANPMGYKEMAYFKNPIYTFSESFFVVFTQAPTVYLMLYLVFPKLILKKKYLAGFAWIILLWFLCGALNLIMVGNVMQPFLEMVLPPDKVPSSYRDPGTSFFMALMATNKAAYSITASALMLKFGKHWYHHQHRSLQLQKENTEAQLQLLTAQVHPHFLFNTLNNIYSKTQKESPQGSQMIMG